MRHFHVIADNAQRYTLWLKAAGLLRGEATHVSSPDQLRGLDRGSRVIVVGKLDEEGQNLEVFARINGLAVTRADL